MLHHRPSASVQVDPRGTSVLLDGEALRMDPVERVPLSRLYFL
jgi:urease alpha subunit